MAIKFMKHYVTNGAVKARVWYSNGQLVDGSKPVTLYARDYTRELAQIFPELYKNDTDMSTDYFEKGLVRIPVGREHYEAALARFQQNEAARAAKRAA